MNTSTEGKGNKSAATAEPGSDRAQPSSYANDAQKWGSRAVILEANAAIPKPPKTIKTVSRDPKITRGAMPWDPDGDFLVRYRADARLIIDRFEDTKSRGFVNVSPIEQGKVLKAVRAHAHRCLFQYIRTRFTNET